MVDENTNTNINTTTGLSLLDSGFSESDTSLAISSIDNNLLSSKGLNLRSASSINNRDNELKIPQLRNTNIDVQNKNTKSIDCSSFFENSNLIRTPVTQFNFNNNGKFSNENSKEEFLSELYTTPDSNIFKNNFDEPDTPITPISPYFHQSRDKIKIFNKYPLNDVQLEKMVLRPDIFNLNLNEKIGKGSNAFVYSCKLSTFDETDNSFITAVKIPISKNKVKYIIQEAKFIIKLREYQNEWFKIESRYYPFIDCYGIYYLNKEKFPLFNKNDELPCLIMKKMDIGLGEYIKEYKYKSSNENLKIPFNIWCKLCQSIFDVLSILKRLDCVHCDLKPDNIMVSCFDVINNNEPIFKVIDFSSANEVCNLTKCPDMTLQYTAPELLDFSRKQLPTFQSDIYSAGLVLLEAATGSAPYSTAGYDHFYLLTVIKEGNVFEWLSPEDNNILKHQPIVKRLLQRLLVDRCTIEEAKEEYRTKIMDIY